MWAPHNHDECSPTHRLRAPPLLPPPCSTTPRFLWDLGTFGNFGISASLVVQLREILTEPSVSWKYELLYVPFLIPFCLASAVTVLVHRRDMEVPWWTPFREAFQRVAGGVGVGFLALVEFSVGFSWQAQALSAGMSLRRRCLRCGVFVCELECSTKLCKPLSDRVNCSYTHCAPAVQPMSASIGSRTL